MADHTDFIRIRGLESSDDEVFQGLGAASLTVEDPGDGGGSVGLGSISEFFEGIAESWDLIWEFVTGQASSADPGDDEDSTPRGRSRAIGALVPVVTSIVPVIAGVPAVVKGMAIFSILPHLINIIIDDVEDAIQDRVDPNSVRNGLKKIHQRLNDIDDHLKTALIWEDGILGIDKSILGTALLQLDEDDKSILRERLTALLAELTSTTDAVEDLTFVDVELKYADNASLHAKGKVLHH